MYIITIIHGFKISWAVFHSNGHCNRTCCFRIHWIKNTRDQVHSSNFIRSVYGLCCKHKTVPTGSITSCNTCRGAIHQDLKTSQWIISFYIKNIITIATCITINNNVVGITGRHGYTFNTGCPYRTVFKWIHYCIIITCNTTICGGCQVAHSVLVNIKLGVISRVTGPHVNSHVRFRSYAVNYIRSRCACVRTHFIIIVCITCGCSFTTKGKFCNHCSIINRIPSLSGRRRCAAQDYDAFKRLWSCPGQ